ncbi:hypothetical protein [Lysobacter silvisoli]|uniref:Uncharacterized protein n=1 Tax=Lysobacter silvisoli TaxID=2293254 RepID=A0A371K370_9GAMM|nr:hypothetical protein [Lysobacter silvisoli]RDZ28375.1 hypothetical protein DX914_04345 [Lysobacter silvisoli]
MRAIRGAKIPHFLDLDGDLRPVVDFAGWKPPAFVGHRDVNQSDVTAVGYLLVTACVASNFYAASLIDDSALRKRAKNIAALVVIALFGYSHWLTYLAADL